MSAGNSLRKLLSPPRKAYSPMIFSNIAKEKNRKGRKFKRVESRVIVNHRL